MTRKKYGELINRGIDGDLSDRDSARLQNLLARNPEAKWAYDDLMKLTTMLNQVEEVEPPPNLKKTVLNSIQTSRYATRQKESGILASVASILPPRKLGLRYAYVFAVGLLAGVVIYALLVERNTSPDISRLYGTMGGTNAALTLETADEFGINLEKVQGMISTRYAKGVVVAMLQLKSEQPVEVVLEFEKKDISFSAIGRQNSSVNSVEIGQNYLRLTNIGENTYTILFDDLTGEASLINCRITCSGTRLFERSVETGKKPE